MAPGFLVAMLAIRYAAGGLLLVAAFGKGVTLRQIGRSREVVLISILILVEVATGAALLGPIDGLPIAGAGVLFAGFAIAQFVGRSGSADRPCGCYGAAAPNARYSYLAVITFALVAAAVLASTVARTEALAPGDLVVARLLGVALTIGAVAAARRGGHPVSAAPSGASTTSTATEFP
jgi:hypothetical protein